MSCRQPPPFDTRFRRHFWQLKTLLCENHAAHSSWATVYPLDADRHHLDRRKPRLKLWRKMSDCLSAPGLCTVKQRCWESGESGESMGGAWPGVGAGSSPSWWRVSWHACRQPAGRPSRWRCPLHPWAPPLRPPPHPHTIEPSPPGHLGSSLARAFSALSLSPSGRSSASPPTQTSCWSIARQTLT